MKKLPIILAILLIPRIAISAPSISGVAGTLDHGETITISGADFGTKSPAKPLVWDDCEHASDGDNVTTSHPGNAASRVTYSDIEPPLTLDADWEMKYRDTPYAPEGESGPLTAQPAPHANSSTSASFGHQDGIGGDGNDGANGWLSIPNTNGSGNYESDWSIFYYYRLVDDWPSCGSSNNNKFFVLNFGGLGVWGGNNYMYWDYNKRVPCSSADYVRVTPQTTNATIEDNDSPRATSMPDTVPVWSKRLTINANTETPEPIGVWQKYEVKVSDDDGHIGFWVDGVDAYTASGDVNWLTSRNNEPGIMSISIGGYYFRSNSPNEEHDDAHRLIDDVYVDDTLSIVILGNASTYSSCTVREPQPQTAHSATEIILTLNQGAIADDSTGYLYVRDENGALSFGYPVVIGTATDDTPVITITSPTSDTTYETAAATVDIAGSASDDSGVDAVTWSNDRGGSGACTGTTSWAKTGIALFEGVNVITATVEDDATQTATDVITVTRTSLATPTPTSVTGTLTHGASIVIAGTGFGAKNPAAPLIWDACTSDPGMANYYDEWQPQSAAGGADYNIQYRVNSYRSIGGPTSRSTHFITGAHAETDRSSTYSQGGTVGLGWNTTSHEFFISYYYRIDPAFEDESEVDADNMKEIALSDAEDEIYSGLESEGYVDWCNNDVPTKTNAGNVRLQRMPIDHFAAPYKCSGNFQVEHRSPIIGWTKMEWEGRLSVADDGEADHPVLALTTRPDIATTYRSHYDNPITSYHYVDGNWGQPEVGDLKFIGLGGFARVPRDAFGVNSFRYFAEVYGDITRTRVMIGNAATYTECTILEPQIPSAWEADGTEATVTVNLGGLTGNTGYLYLFNSDNVRNNEGLEVTLGAAVDNPPTITIQKPTTNVVYSQSAFSVTVSGVATDDSSVEEVTWDSDRGDSGVCTGTTSWTVTFSGLLAGDNVITITARDDIGQETDTVLTITQRFKKGFFSGFF